MSQSPFPDHSFRLQFLDFDFWILNYGMQIRLSLLADFYLLLKTTTDSVFSLEMTLQ